MLRLTTDNLLKKRDFITKFLRIIIVPLMALIFSLLFIQVLFRYVFKISVWGIEGSALYLITYSSFIGGAIAFSNDNHPRVRFVFEKMPERVRYFLEIFFDLLLLIFSFALMKEGYIQAIISIRWYGSAPKISLFWPYFAIPLGGLFMFIIVGLNTLIAIIERKNVAFIMDDIVEDIDCKQPTR